MSYWRLPKHKTPTSNWAVWEVACGSTDPSQSTCCLAQPPSHSPQTRMLDRHLQKERLSSSTVSCLVSDTQPWLVLLRMGHFLPVHQDPWERHRFSTTNWKMKQPPSILQCSKNQQNMRIWRVGRWGETSLGFITQSSHDLIINQNFVGTLTGFHLQHKEKYDYLKVF